MLRQVLVTFVIGAASASSLSACPVCESETGRQVRAGIFDEGFGRKLVLTLLPFPIFLGVVAAIHFGFPFWMGERRLAARLGAGVAEDRSSTMETPV